LIFTQVHHSTDLVNWTRLGLLRRTNNDPNPLLFADGDAGGSSQRFYRTFTNHLITFFPKPSGPFAVGSIDRVMIDPARTNLYRYTPRTNAFMVTFWYPAEPPKAGALPGVMGTNASLPTRTSIPSLALIAGGRKYLP
jgi:hypothetical protein